MPPDNIKKPKRVQVKNACVNCQRACKKCDDMRPCQRCIKSNIQDTCKDSTRKPRQRGIKRGPYKKRQKPKPASPQLPSSSSSSSPSPPLPPPEPPHMGTFDSSPEPPTPQRYQRPAPLNMLSSVALCDRPILTPRYISASPSSFFLGPKHIPFSASRFDDTYRQQKSNPVSPMLSSRRKELEDERGYQSAGPFDTVDEPSEMRIRRLSRILGNSQIKNC